MTIKGKALPRPTSALSAEGMLTSIRQMPSPGTATSTGECLNQIEALGQRINGYVQFMCQVGSLNGTSDEAKKNAIAAFHAQMVHLERELGRIQEDLRLG